MSWNRMDEINEYQLSFTSFTRFITALIVIVNDI